MRAKLRAGGKEPTLDGSLGDAQHLGNFGNRKFLDVMQQEDGPDLWFQLCKRPSNCVGFVNRFDCCRFRDKLRKGSKGMSGAAMMSAKAAIRSGCGLVTVATVESERVIVASAIPEIMTASLDTDAEGAPEKNSLKILSSQIQKADVVLLGPGIRNTDASNAMMLEAFRTIEQPLVADAGALGALVGNLSILKKRKYVTILTPHAGEMSRLLGITRDELEIDRIAIASQFAREYRSILVLKGAPTIIALPSGKVFVNSTGNPGMATAGSGDVLAGMIAGILAQETAEPEGAVLFAVYAHGRAGDIAAMNGSMQTLIATDIIASLHTAFNQLQVT